MGGRDRPRFRVSAALSLKADILEPATVRSLPQDLLSNSFPPLGNLTKTKAGNHSG